MHCILFYETGPNYIERRAPYRAAHLALAKGAFDRGEIVLAGALDDPPDGAVLVFRGETQEAAQAAAEAFANADPYVANGLIVRWHVRKWRTVLGDGASPPAA